MTEVKKKHTESIKTHETRHDACKYEDSIRILQTSIENVGWSDAEYELDRIYHEIHWFYEIGLIRVDEFSIDTSLDNLPCQKFFDYNDFVSSEYYDFLKRKCNRFVDEDALEELKYNCETLIFSSIDSDKEHEECIRIPGANKNSFMSYLQTTINLF